MKPKNYKKVKIVMIILLWIIVISSLKQGYDLYQYQKENPQKEYEIQSWEEKPEDLKVKLNMSESIKKKIYLGLLIVAGIYVCNYKIKGDESVLGLFIKGFKEMNLEEEE